jgi:hypothetical protein
MNACSTIACAASQIRSLKISPGRFPANEDESIGFGKTMISITFLSSGFRNRQKITKENS